MREFIIYETSLNNEQGGRISFVYSRTLRFAKSCATHKRIWHDSTLVLNEIDPDTKQVGKPVAKRVGQGDWFDPSVKTGAQRQQERRARQHELHEEIRVLLMRLQGLHLTTPRNRYNNLELNALHHSAKPLQRLLDRRAQQAAARQGGQTP